jgi:hypothetical protein
VRELILSFVAASLSLWICTIMGTDSVSAADPEVAGIWLFDEDQDDVAEDSSGSGNDGVINGGAKWTNDGKFGGALEFDGIDDWVEVPDDDSVEFPQGVDFTLACWLRVTTPEDSPPMIIAKHYHTTSQMLPWYGLYYADQAKAATGDISLFLRNAAATDFHIAGVTKIDDGEWHHIVGTREGGTIKLYVDGVEEASMDGADFDVGTNDGCLHFMSHYGRFMGGVLDEVIILRRALSADEIGDLMNNGIEKVMAVSSSGKLPTTWARIKAIPR